MIGLAFLLFAMQANPATPPPNAPSGARNTLGFDDPMPEMIDFLGRRMLCAEDDQNPAERTRLRCGALAGEERALRQRFAGDARALRWLDLPAREFRMEPQFVMIFDGPTPVWPRRIEQIGTDLSGRAYRLVIDADADHGRSTRVSVSFADLPERSFTLSNRLFPMIDLRTVAVRTFDPPSRRMLFVSFSYGQDRRYCPTVGDNRQEVTVTFDRRSVSARDERRTNCGRETVRIDENVR